MSWSSLVVCLFSLVLFTMSSSSSVPSSHYNPSVNPVSPLPSLARYGRSLLLAGGGDWDSQTDQHRRLIDMAGGVGVARLGLVVAASDQPEVKVREYTPLFKAAGALSVEVIPVYVTNMTSNSDPDVVRLIGQMTGFFFAGGEMWRLVQAFYNSNRVASPALVAIRQRHLEGAVVAGTSAGSAGLTSTVMVVAGNSWEALRNGAKVTSDLPGDLVYDPNGGLDLFNGYVVDILRFSNRGREGRLIKLLADTRLLARGTNFGLGLDEMTSLVITWAGTDDVTGEVVGPGGVTLIDVSKATVESSGDFAIREVSMSYLTAGDAISLKSHKITFSPTKRPLSQWKRFQHAQTSDRIFHGKDADSQRKSEFHHVAVSLFDSSLDVKATGNSEESDPKFKVTMSRCAPDSAVYVRRMGSFSNDVYSYKNLIVDIMGI